MPLKNGYRIRRRYISSYHTSQIVQFLPVFSGNKKMMMVKQHIYRYAIFALSVIVAAGLGLLWEFGPVGPIFSVLLIPLIFAATPRGKRGKEGRYQRYSIALAYYLAGSHGLPGGSSVFFGPGHITEGILLWLISSALLAAGWAFADKPWKVIAVLIFDAVPPLGLFDWLSPLAGAGVFFPGAGLVGLMLFIVALFGILHIWYQYDNNDNKTAENKVDRKSKETLRLYRLPFVSAIAVVVCLSCIFNFYYSYYGIDSSKQATVGWHGVDLSVGPSTSDVMYNMQRMQRWIAQTQVVASKQNKQMKQNEKNEKNEKEVILLPETLTTWWAGNSHEVQAAIPSSSNGKKGRKGRKEIWLVGASVPVGHGLLADGIEQVTRHHSKMVFASAFPVPVSMWHPWSSAPGGFEAVWWEPVRRIAGVKAWASICYDQLLPWVWMEGVIQHPRVILLTNNEWWARGTGIPQIQRATSWAWGRLIGAPVIEAENA
jgi:hypothetical protein